MAEPDDKTPFDTPNTAAMENYKRIFTEESPTPNFLTFADKAMLGLCETLALLFGLPFGEDLYNDKPVTGWHLFYLAIGLVFAVVGPMWPWIRTRTWLPTSVAASLSKAPLDARLWIAVLLLLFLYGTAPEIYQRATAPVAPRVGTGFTQQQVDAKVAAATKSIQAQLDNATRQRDAALADAAALRQRLNTPPLPPADKPIWNSEEIAIRSDLWRTIQRNVDGVVRAYNYSDTLLGKWEDQIPLNKKDYLRELSDLRGLIVATSNKIQELRRDYPNYQDISAVLDQPYVGPLLNSIDDFSLAVSSLPDELPPNYQITIRPKAGAVLRETKGMLAWISNVRTTAGIKQKELSEMGQKQ